MQCGPAAESAISRFTRAGGRRAGGQGGEGEGAKPPVSRHDQFRVTTENRGPTLLARFYTKFKLTGAKLN